MIKRKKILISIFSAFTLAIIASLIYWYTLNLSRTQDLDARVNQIEDTANFLGLDIHYIEYENSNDLEAIELLPTERTNSLLERWEKISDTFPSIEYPSTEIERENWIEVRDTYLRNQDNMAEVTKEITEGYDGIDSESIHYYIFYENQTTEQFDSILDDYIK